MPPLKPTLGRRPFLGAGLGLGAAAVLAAAGCTPGPTASGSDTPAWQRRLQAGTDARPRELGVLGDSISFGGGVYGSSPPKYAMSYVGQLRSGLLAAYGDAGTGWVVLNQALWPVTADNRGWDPRLSVHGAVTKVPRGLFRHTCARIPAGASRKPTAYVELTAEGTSFSTLVIGQESGRSVQLVSVDGGAPVRLRNVVQDGPTPDVEARTGTHPRHLWTDVPAGAPGRHTLRVWAEGGAVDLVAVRASTGAGRVVVTSAAVSGESLETFCGPGADDEAGGTTGLGFIDTLAFDLLLVELGANDYNGGHPLDATRGYLLQVLQRQRARGGDVAMIFPPISSPKLYPGNGAPTYEQYAAMFAEVSASQQVPFLDLTHLWGQTFADSDALQPPRYADHAVHPTDLGAADIAARCRAFLGL